MLQNIPLPWKIYISDVTIQIISLFSLTLFFIFSPAAAPKQTTKCLCAGVWKVEGRIRVKRLTGLEGSLNSRPFKLHTTDWRQQTGFSPASVGPDSVSKQLLSVWILKLPQRRFRAFAFGAISFLLCQLGNHSDAPFVNIPSTKQMNKKKEARNHLWATELKCTAMS